VIPLKVTDDGDIEHVELAGDPEHVRAIVPLKPGLPTNEMGYVAVAPAATVADPPEPPLPPDTLKSTPVPVSVSVCVNGLPAPAATVSAPVRAPPAVGMKVIDT
jgi:hypothetical protein